MKIFIGADHQGFGLKRKLLDYLVRAGYDVKDDGDEKLDPDDDYPVYAAKVAADILASSDNDPRGILICSSGQGICMAANRYKGIRAMLGYDRESIKSTRNDDDANVLCLPAKILQADLAFTLVETFLNTPFAAAARFKRRIAQIDEV